METQHPPFRSGFVSIIGRPNVGKSTLLNRILGQKIAITTDKPQTTRNRILGIHNLPTGQILFLDTPGIHRGKGKLNRYMVDQAISACSDVDAILFLVEATDRVGGGDDFILEILGKGQVPVVLVINKIDLVPKPELLALIDSYSQRFSFHAIIPASGLTGNGVERVLDTILPMLPEGPRYYPEDMVTDLPERFIAAEMIREQILKQTREEIPYGVAVTVERFSEEPEKNLVVIQAVILVERDTHKGILLGKQGSRIRSLGKAARLEIERFLGTRVFLELFVKVQKNWTQSARMLKELGYE
ncbi:GTPase Era [Desulfuromonas versatilis]|uniref:GTPase Era n=1 Tax=Desulfuromonas versatilis TaxID=2802975 RepID=A0ABN6DYJ8_9BACT|nr:GTPase Era [Desulfuromonas versatilis]BCR05130.1 GTPase Era [Desulfuromonas versatilis]